LPLKDEHKVDMSFICICLCTARQIWSWLGTLTYASVQAACTRTLLHHAGNAVKSVF
jgi:hypothetical protein